MLNKRRSFGTRKVSPPQPTCMTAEQKASYLADLRTNRPARPTGSRPLPSRPSALSTQDEELTWRPEASLSSRLPQGRKDVTQRYSMPVSGSLSTVSSLQSLKGRPLIHAPQSNRRVSPTELQYRPSTSREYERFEAHSLREALEQLDRRDEEGRIYVAAQEEASDLVWKHMNPQAAEDEKTAPYRNPDLAKKRYVVRHDGSALDHQRRSSSHRDFSNSSTGSCESNGGHVRSSKRGSRGHPTETWSHQSTHGRRTSSSNRHVSTGSHKGMFRNPEDEIYEVPEEALTTARDATGPYLAQTKASNAPPRSTRPLPEKPNAEVEIKKRSSISQDISRATKQQFQQPIEALPISGRVPAPPVASDEMPATFNEPTMEIRSDDIRAATSFRRKDRSPKLPTPTAVSDKLGRPIVSFDPKWQPSESPRGSLDMDRPRSRTPLSKSERVPIVPSINLPDEQPSHRDNGSMTDVPQISIQGPDAPPSVLVSHKAMPTINLPDDQRSQPAPPESHINGQTQPLRPDFQAPSRPLPSINVDQDLQKSSRSLPRQQHSQPTSFGPTTVSGRLPWLSRSPANVPSQHVACSTCGLPISGRIVTASGAEETSAKTRFHPECFSCHHCSTALECVSFYPEPETARQDRLQDPAADPSVRFYCHLDFHELFSPRCAQCKTPIETSVVLAAGKAYHEGHFFCAECGDPFSSTSPFVESKGYAYCVRCHTKRTSARCRACKGLILDDVAVEALGAKWHAQCFKCHECQGEFGEEGRFFVREIEIELTEKEKRKGLDFQKIEERAVCEGCEGRRLKSWDVNAFL